VFDRADPPVAPARAAQVALGIDPGLTRCGYAAVRRAGGRAEALEAGVLRTDAARPLPERLADLAGALGALVERVAPDVVVVERVLFQSNARTAISVGQASGLALAAAAGAGIPVVQYSPNEVKLAVTGDGRADKRAVQVMVTRLLDLAAVPEPPDAADALALALCHLWRARSTVAAEASPDGSDRFDAAVRAALAREARR
jgi:crossover junction endodeoxyribonuclease RuvC